MSVIYRRNLGPVPHLDLGEYTTETMTGRPVLCCASCGSIQEIPADTHRIDPTGIVVPALRCPMDACGRFEYVRLESWRE